MNTASYYEICIDDYLRMKGSDQALRSSVLETAMYIEDTLGIRLTDEDLRPEVLGSATAVRRLVQQRIENAGRGL